MKAKDTKKYAEKIWTKKAKKANKKLTSRYAADIWADWKVK